MPRCLLLILLLVVVGSLSAATSEPKDVVGEILVRPVYDSWAAEDLRHALEKMPDVEKVAALRRLAATMRKDIAPEVVHYVLNTNPTLACAAIESLTGLWPTDIEHAEAVRQVIVAESSLVATAAMAFAVRITDERAIPLIAHRLSINPDDAAARDALRRLTNVDLADGNAWLAWHDEREKVLVPLLEELTKESESPTEAVASGAIHRLMAIKERPSQVAQALIRAAARPEPAIRDIARTGLRLMAGPVAACWRAKGVQNAEVEVVTPVLAAAAVIGPVASPTAESGSIGDMIFAGICMAVVLGLALLWHGGGKKASAPPPPATEPISTRIVKRRERMKWLN